MYGSFFAVSGIVLLAVLVLRFDTSHDFPTAMANFLPRLSIVIVVELLSFFFLALYRSGLADLKHYQAEMTSADLKYASLRSALACRDSHLSTYVIANLAVADVSRELPSPHDAKAVQATTSAIAEFSKSVAAIAKK